MDEIPTELSPLEKLEQILIAQWTLYEKIMVMPTGQHRKIKGATYNVPVQPELIQQVLNWLKVHNPLY